MTRKSNTLYIYLFSIFLVYTFVSSRILPVETARILAVESIAGKSHWNYVSSILRVLSNNGHQVTVFTPFPEGERANYTEVDTSIDFGPGFILKDLIVTMDFMGSPMTMIKTIRTKRTFMCDKVYSNMQLNKIMEDNENTKFDILIIEHLGYDCDLYLAKKLKLPFIYLISSPMLTFAERSIFGDIPNPATISYLFSDHAIPKTFVQRFLNTAMLAYSTVLLSYDKWIRNYTTNRKYDLGTSTIRPSLTFVNSHFISEASRPFPQNVIQVGGIHLKPPGSIPNVSKTKHTLTHARNNYNNCGYRVRCSIV